MADTRTFPATPAQLSSLAAMLASHGLVLDTAQSGGEVKEDGWDVVWAYSNATLTLTVKKHPFGEEGIMWGKVNAALG